MASSELKSPFLSDRRLTPQAKHRLLRACKDKTPAFRFLCSHQKNSAKVFTPRMVRVFNAGFRVGDRHSMAHLETDPFNLLNKSLALERLDQSTLPDEKRPSHVSLLFLLCALGPERCRFNIAALRADGGQRWYAVDESQIDRLRPYL